MKIFILILFVLGMGKVSLGQTNTFPSTGNVGIGTMLPIFSHHVVNSGSVPTTVASLNTHAGSYSRFLLMNDKQENSYGDLIQYSSLNPAVLFGNNAANRVMLYSSGANSEGLVIGTFTAKPLILGTSNSERLRIDLNGNVGLGITSPSEKLSVNGNIRAKEVKVEITGWSDFVFEPDYKLRSLFEIEEFIKKNGHLPEIPSAAEVKKDGIFLGEMNSKLLQKIEELTLHLIEQNKMLEQQTVYIKSQDGRLKALEKQSNR